MNQCTWTLYHGDMFYLLEGQNSGSGPKQWSAYLGTQEDWLTE